MNEVTEFAALTKLGADRARAWHSLLADGLEPLVQVRRLQWRDLNAELDWLEGTGKAEPCLYVFDFEEPAAAPIARVAFNTYRDLQVQLRKTHPKSGALRSIPRLNPRTQGNYLYVGKVNGENQPVRARLRQHFGEVGSGTSALNLIHWLPASCLPLKLTVARYPGLPAGVIEFLEDLLWGHKQPLLGRKGGN